MKPKLELVNAEIQVITRIDGTTTRVLRVSVKNNNHQHKWFRWFLRNKSILNLKIEACFIDGKFTYHLKFDENEFLFLSACKCCEDNGKPSVRYFISGEISEQLVSYYNRRLIDTNHRNTFESLIDNKFNLRVKISGYDELTGQGVAIEKIFPYPLTQSFA